ncbi:flap endonuclease Xni [Shewanella sp. NIFS-20-20]|uniref:flap endonuclease Xni n=1 Tax=Shewanella sp. NIFS-20-20 TaxID=2853806 RepID=UPI001C43A595|nr:flap endonuclease Xni [Shewanella sp. NIFS-20-20]MBV7315355.1 flap endonuclease Xni [Shewanella sp. NIFS-20-20]
MNTFLIIDGMNLTRRLHATMGAPVDGAQLQQRLEQACDKLKRLHQPSHLVIVWDGDNLSWRKQLYPDYKKGRKPMPEDLAAVLPRLKQALTELGWHGLQADSEADDVIATLAAKLVAHQGQAMIVSTDKGFAQLQHSNIHQWDYFAKAPFDHAALQTKLGVDLSQLLDFFALAGDSGNKIPGIAGIGGKTAAGLLNQYHDLANLYQHLDQLNDKLAAKLGAGKDMARLSYKLAKLNQELPLQVSLRQYRC